MSFKQRVVLMSATLGIAVAAFAGTQQASAARLCPQIVLPVCGVKADGVRSTFTNSCFAHRAGATVLHRGACQGPICTFVWDPVCARNVVGVVRSFSNTCWAEVENAVVLSKGLCK
jgi:hypothetical protein